MCIRDRDHYVNTTGEHYGNVFVHKSGKLENRQFLAKMHQIAPNCVSLPRPLHHRGPHFSECTRASKVLIRHCQLIPISSHYHHHHRHHHHMEVYFEDYNCRILNMSNVKKYVSNKYTFGYERQNRKVFDQCVDYCVCV